MTGYMDVVSLSTTAVWCAFQTGNTIQLGLALARALFPSNNGLQQSMSAHTLFAQIDYRFSLCSLVCFLLGASVCRITNPSNTTRPSLLGHKVRIWLIVTTLLQALLTLCSALLHSDRFAGAGFGPYQSIYEFAALGLASASMGVQGGVAFRLESFFASSVVFTTIWIQLITEPTRARFPRDIAQLNRLLAVFAVLVGAVVSKVILDKQGAVVTLVVAGVMRALVAPLWMVGRVE